jgi:hypothetical protein
MDPEAIENTLSKTVETAEGPNTVQHDDKTEELVTSLESGVDQAYTKFQDSTMTGFTKIQGLVAENLPELKKQWKGVKLPQLPDVKVGDKVNELTKNLKIEDYVKPENIENFKQRGGEFLSKASENTNKVLDDIDSDLEKIENMTIDYAQQLGSQIGSFLKTQINTLNENSTTDKDSNKETSTSSSAWNWSGWSKQLTNLVSGESPETVIANEKKTELLFNLPKGIVPGTRAESQVHALQSDPSIYLNSVKNNEFKDYKLTDEQKAESKELVNNPALHLVDIYNKIVQIEENEENEEDKVNKKISETKNINTISDIDFWKVYYGKKDQIMEDEQKRRALLEKSKNKEEDEEEEDFDWDD